MDRFDVINGVQENEAGAWEVFVGGHMVARFSSRENAERDLHRLCAFVPRKLSAQGFHKLQIHAGITLGELYTAIIGAAEITGKDPL